MGLFLLSAGIHSQEVNRMTIQGTVKDQNGNPVEFANVFIKNRMTGTVTDPEGKYQFEMYHPDNDTLICIYTGYKRQEIPLRPASGNHELTVDIVLFENITRLQEVEVSASTFTSGDKKGVTLSSLDIIKTPGAAADVMLAIQTFPGVQQVEEGAGLFVRGGDVSETVFIIDGAYLYHPYRFESPNGGYFGAISPFLLKNTYFSCGGFGVEYTNSISGALVMESPDMINERKGYVSVGLANSSVRFAMPVMQDKLGIALSANYSNSKPMFMLNGHNRKFSKYPVTYDLNLNLTYKYSKNGIAKLFVFRESDDLGVSVDNPEDEAFYHGKSVSNLANLSIRHTWNDRFLTAANVAVSTFKQNADLAKMDLSTKNIMYQASFSGQYAISDRLYSTFGIDLFNNSEKIAGQFLISEYDLDSTFNIDVNYHSDRIGVYDKLKYSIMPKLNVTLGVRWERESVTEKNIFDYRGALNWNFADNWNLVSSIGKYHQFPDPDCLDQYYGNPELGVFDAIHYIVGVSCTKKEDHFRVEFYYKDYNHLLMNDSERYYTNKGYGYAKGIDIFWKKKWKNVNGRASLSLLDTKRKWGDVPYLASTKFDITCTFTSVLEYQFHKHLSSGMKYRYATGSPYSSTPTTCNDKRVADYHMLDMSLNYLHNFFDNNLTVFYVACNNVLGIDNVLGYRYSADYSKRIPVKSSVLRSFYFGFQFSF
jgi:outer membrane cobalamin receptor